MLGLFFDAGLQLQSLHYNIHHIDGTPGSQNKRFSEDKVKMGPSGPQRFGVDLGTAEQRSGFVLTTGDNAKTTNPRS